MNIVFSEFWNKKSSPTPTKGNRAETAGSALRVEPSLFNRSSKRALGEQMLRDVFLRPCVPGVRLSFSFW